MSLRLNKGTAYALDAAPYQLCLRFKSDYVCHFAQPCSHGSRRISLLFQFGIFHLWALKIFPIGYSIGWQESLFTNSYTMLVATSLGSISKHRTAIQSCYNFYYWHSVKDTVQENTSALKLTIVIIPKDNIIAARE